MDQALKTSQCINQKGALTPWRILHQQVWWKTSLDQLSGDEYILESIPNTNNSSNI